MMKKLIAGLLVFCLLLSLSCAFAATYDSTKEFVAFLDSEGIKYTENGVNESSGYESVIVKYYGDNKEHIDLNVFFNQEGSKASVRVWNVINFDASNESSVVAACDQLNSDWAYVKFYVDHNDNSVTAQFDIVLRTGTGTVGQIVHEGMMRTMYIVDDAYPTLKPFAK